MSSEIVRDAFEAALRSAYPAMELVKVENEIITPPKDAQGKAKAFLACLYLASEDPLGIGNHIWREQGSINVLIYALAGRGSPVAAADALRNLFASKNLHVSAPGVRLALLKADPLTGYMGKHATTGVYDVGMVDIAYEFDFTR
jgi:hypothetical protein